MRRDDPTHHRWPLGDKGNKQREWGWVSAERLPAAVSVSCLPDSMTSVRSSRAIVRYPTWIAKTSSRPKSQESRRPWACSAKGSAACEVMRPFAWSDLILDHSHKLVSLQSPFACATRSGGNSNPNFENWTTRSRRARQIASLAVSSTRGTNLLTPCWPC